ncbi:hypothetical protein RHO13_13230 (plasmid) [Orbus wheelerorum]|uniref:hypothetical protein n=1 Tax=Orbus wheelerorum TaxID=3074111 RepID=UPI00370D537E
MENLKKTVRLKKEESLLLQDKAFTLTKKAIYQGNKVVYQESDIVHFIIEKFLNKIDINEQGELKIKE